MKKTVVAVVALMLCFSAVVWAGNNENARENAADRALENAPCQSALVERYGLSGNRIPIYWEAELPQDEPSFWAIGWAEPTGRDSKESPFGPGRKNNPENGAGRVSIRLWVDGVEVALRTSAGVYYRTIDVEGIGPVTGWWIIRDFWIEFPANYFATGDHTFESIIAANLEGWPHTYVGLAEFQE